MVGVEIRKKRTDEQDVDGHMAEVKAGEQAFLPDAETETEPTAADSLTDTERAARAQARVVFWQSERERGCSTVCQVEPEAAGHNRI